MNEAYSMGGGRVESFEEWWPRLRSDPEYDSTLCWTAIEEASGLIVGFAQCWTSAFVKDIVVSARWRRCGLGKSMMFDIFRTFKSRGANSVKLKIARDNPHGATHFYRQLGMEEVVT